MRDGRSTPSARRWLDRARDRGRGLNAKLETLSTEAEQLHAEQIR